MICFYGEVEKLSFNYHQIPSLSGLLVPHENFCENIFMGNSKLDFNSIMSRNMTKPTK